MIRKQVESDWVKWDEKSVAEGKAQEPWALSSARQVLERAQALADRLRPAADPSRLTPLTRRLEVLAHSLTQMESNDRSQSLQARRDLHFEVRSLARSIAFTNPLLDFKGLLFIKRHDAAGVFHMCDQYYGCNARPGGGLYVLTDPCGANPGLRDVLEDSVVEAGAMRGRTLQGGAFLSPEVSFDGKTLLFAYTEAKAWERFKGKEAYEWTPESVYHIFKCRSDGTGLVQLTEGSVEDFDPCFLPNGRVAFISQRRGGYLRCGRNCPVYALFSMADDGSDIRPLSFHETHEWHPSVTHDGRIVYTRWDYVDRDTNIAHHLWTCLPDGRDPRSFHGNYPIRRESRPWMEMSIRAIPNSQKFVATAAAHHGHAFGSLVMIDPSVEDDRASSQLIRLTPEVPFPEAEGRPIEKCMVYGTPWPLSEEDFLCAWAPDSRNHGLYWIDRSGNRELLYRDPDIASVDPIPLRPRPRPPVIPDLTGAEADAGPNDAARPASVVLLNVYDSDFSWPPGIQVTDLRVIQVLPKTTPPPNDPRIGIGNQTNARAVLGVVPVERDGSAFFQVPAGKEIYFQALDSRGMAVQSMRSGTYLHPGETLTCRGCHEPKYRAPSGQNVAALALNRPPSILTPEPEGSNPFSYVRLVQPVLDRNCVTCHCERKALDLSGGEPGVNGWTTSYVNLAQKHGFYYDVSNGSVNAGAHGGSRTQVNEFGARASSLLSYLNPKHYQVQMSQEDFRRVTLWLDCNSEFFGAYENSAAQSRGEVVRPSLD